MARTKPEDFKVEDFYFLKVKNMWRYFWSEHPAFWCICGYLFIEYFRPQAIYPAINILPWAQLFLLASIGFSIFDKQSRLYWTTTHWWVVLFAIQIHISILFAYDISWSKWKYFDFFQWIIIFFVVTRVVTTQERLYVFFIVFFLCSLKISIGTAKIWAMRGFAFTAYGINGPAGFFQNSGELSIQMLVLFCSSIFLVRAHWSQSNKLEQIILFFALITPIMTILGASSRGSQLALLTVAVILISKYIYKPKVIILSLLALALAFIFIPEEQKSRFQSIGEDGTSIQRILYWQRGIEMTLDHPFFGVGYYNFIPYFTDNYPSDVLFVDSEGVRRAELPHNIFVQVSTDAGIPALFFFVGLIITLLRPVKLQSGYHFLSSGISLGVVGFLVSGMFVTVTYYPFIWIAASMHASLQVLESKR